MLGEGEVRTHTDVGCHAVPQHPRLAGTDAEPGDTGTAGHGAAGMQRISHPQKTMSSGCKIVPRAACWAKAGLGEAAASTHPSAAESLL